MVDRVKRAVCCAVMLCAAALIATAALAQPDPFRPSAPPATPPARARANPPADVMWVVDPRTQCRVQIRRRETISIQINWHGNCPNGVADGAGALVLLFPDLTETRCEVTLRAGLAHGRGVCAFPDGHSYEAEYAAGRPVGPGTLILADGSRYHGMVRDGVPHGRGTLTGPKIVALTGEWEHGCLYERASGQFFAVLREVHSCSGGTREIPN